MRIFLNIFAIIFLCTATTVLSTVTFNSEDENERSINKKERKKKKSKFDDNALEEQMQVLSVCYLLLEKMMKAQSEKVKDFFDNTKLDKSSLFNKFRVDTITKCLKNTGKIPIKEIQLLLVKEKVSPDFYINNNILTLDYNSYQKEDIDLNLNKEGQILLSLINEIDSELNINLDIDKIGSDFDITQNFDAEKQYPNQYLLSNISMSIVGICILFGAIFYYLFVKKEWKQNTMKKKK